MKREYQSADQRNTACNLAPTDFPRALDIARGIERPWYRCQALTCMAEHAPNPDTRDSILQEAFDAAFLTAEPNRIVRVASWPVRLLCDIGRSDELKRRTDRLLDIAELEIHPVKKANALLALLGSVTNAPQPQIISVLDALRHACTESYGWQTGRILFLATTIVNRIDHEQAVQTALLIQRKKIRRHALKLIGE